MRILYSDDYVPDTEMMDILQRAATACVANEGMEPDNAEISLSFVTKEEIRSLNKMYRNIYRITDVLSFPLIEDFEKIDSDDEYMLGDVVICLEKAREQAEEYGHSEEREIVYLFVHSVCHLLGYDHMEIEDKAVMRAAEEKVMKYLDLERS